ncbi:F0F1 ATP synthase subunit delta [Steroidobacter sp. S1-65]|uniref:ATP synthase subunit delta n=1 Tax=Steroidobacter gossypii TaxID=2805490 RepID=A0ABS1WT78_9GAMM|nr:F0F1 ATP synthase subunit delta [Steroidobacter gossypii]MBM0104185.1 F0F1 ATP synthase subunit delta [Steroidobacter gossypii]
MAEKATIARPYAKAAFESARQHNAFERWSTVLATASSVVQDERVAPLLSNPLVKPEELTGLIADIAGESMDDRTRNFLATLADNRRLALLPEIASMYEALRAEAENTADVQVVSAVALNDAQKQRLAAALKQRLKREVRLHCEVDESLIGGAIVRAGDFVIDGSLKARLDRLAVEMTH